MRRVNMWKKTSEKIDLVSSAGHFINFRGINIFPHNFVLRHYIILSAQYAEQKYGKRVFSKYEVTKKGWHGDRCNFTMDQLKLPEINRLKEITESGWDKTDPWPKHEFLGKGYRGPIKSFFDRCFNHLVKNSQSKWGWKKFFDPREFWEEISFDIVRVFWSLKLLIYVNFRHGI